MGIIADKIQECAKNPILGDRMFRTTYRVLYVPGVYNGTEVLHGRLDPSQHLDPTSVQAESDSYVRRYGPGAGTAYVRQQGIGQAISVVPDAQHALRGLGLEEGTYRPGDKALAYLGVTSLGWEDMTDLQACTDFQDAVIRCVDLGLPLGTDRSQWTQPTSTWTSPAPPPNTVPVKTPLDTSNQGTANNVVNSVSAAPLANVVDLQTIIAQTINATLPALISAEIARAMPKDVPATATPTVPDSLGNLKSQLDSATATLNAISSALKGAAIPASGGGRPMNVLRKIAAIMQGSEG